MRILDVAGSKGVWNWAEKRTCFRHRGPSGDTCNIKWREGMFALFNTHSFNSDHRSDYEDFVRDLSKPFSLRLSSRADTYMASTIQAFDVPWPTIQANAIYFSNSMLSVSDDQHILALYYTWVFGMLKQRLRQWMRQFLWHLQDPFSLSSLACMATFGGPLRKPTCLTPIFPCIVFKKLILIIFH